MSTIDNYPPGAAHDSSAPYYEREIPKRDFNCKVSFVISKKMPIATQDYIIDNEDEFGIDVSTNFPEWKEDYLNDSRYMGIDGLLMVLEDYIIAELEDDKLTPRHRKSLEEMLNECQGWEVEEIEIEEL